MKSTVGGKAAGRGVVRERAASLQQEDQAERHTHRGAASGVLREAQRSPEEEDHGGPEAASEAGIGQRQPPRSEVALSFSRSLSASERQFARRCEVGRLLEEALADLGLAGNCLACRLTTDRESRRLNRRFAGVDSATDVLSFPASRPGDGSAFRIAPGEDTQLGDIVISVPTALRQSQEAGADPTSEVGLLAIHGLLHLLGHDHYLARDASRMTIATRQLLSQHAARRGWLPPRVPPLQPSA